MRQYSCGDCKHYRDIGQDGFGRCVALIPLYVFTTDDDGMLSALVFTNGGLHDYGDECDCFERGE